MMIKYLLFIFGAVAAFEDKTIVEYVAANGFNTLGSALTSAGLNQTLSEQGPFTVFAPTDAAFAKLGNTLNTLSAEQLKTILLYHVASGFVLGPQITGTQSLATVEGQSITLVRNSQGITINNASTVTTADVIVNNGVIHVIDTVLIPPVLPTVQTPSNLTISQVLLRDDTRFKDLVLALLLADLFTTLEQSEFTLFAPTDAAFAVYKDNLLSPESPNAQAVYQEVLKYHVVPGARKASQLSNGQKLFTLHGTPISVSINSAGVMVNNATVIDADIPAKNGVIHAIDKLLVPSDISQVAQGSG